MSEPRKRLINAVDDCVDDSLAGLVAVNPGLCLLKGHRRVVIRADMEKVLAAGKVTILTGGGSGHEPGHTGAVGPGMASASVAGPIFTSPPPGDILAALRAIGRGNKAGVLVMFNNYTGDRLTFGTAIERAKKEGIKLAVHIIADDCALKTTDKTAGRRGLAGCHLALKIAGALAEDGKSLQEILEVLTYVSENMGTIGLCLSPCSVPGRGPTFHLKDDEMALGLGLHGEAGVMNLKIMSAHDTVDAMLRHMTNPANETHFDLATGDHVACLLNNLGTLTFLEMNIIGKEIIDFLERCGVVVERFYSTHIVTSQEMSGVSVTILRVNDTLKNALDAETTAPGWKFPCLPPNTRTRTTPGDIDIDVSDFQRDGLSRQDVGEYAPTETQKLIYKSIRRCCESLISAESLLDQLDTRCGDGDCGYTFKTGARAILSCLGTEDNPGLPVHCPHRLGHTLASIIQESMGGSSGGLYSLFMTAASGAIQTSFTPDAWCEALKVGTQSIMRHGGAAPGYRTMLDALCPAVESFESTLKSSNGLDAFQTAVLAAEEGARLTAGMKAQAGRASYVQSASSLGDPDPGATAVRIWMRAILDTLSTDTETL